MLALTACSQMPKQAFNGNMHTDVRTIALLEPATNDSVEVVNVGHAGMAFGLIGGLIAAEDIKSKTMEFTQLTARKAFNCTREFQYDLKRALESAGYNVTIVNPRRKEPASFLETYGQLDQGYDAYLDSNVRCGYFSDTAAADYIPAVRSEVKLIKRSTKEVLYQDVVSYGYEFKRGQVSSLPAESKFFFRDYDNLKWNVTKAIDGMRTGIPLVAKQLAYDIRRSDADPTAIQGSMNSGASVETVSVPTADTSVTTMSVTNVSAVSVVPVSAPVAPPVLSTQPAPTAAPSVLLTSDGADIVSIERPAFRTGVSSVTVERLARQAGCTGGKGASLLTQDGPIEIYRMVCDTGTVVTMKCELRQCVPIN